MVPRTHPPLRRRRATASPVAAMVCLIGYSHSGRRSSGCLADRRKPDAILPDHHTSARVVAIGPCQPRQRHTLCLRVAHETAVVEIQILRVAIDHHADVANAAVHERVGRCADLGAGRRFENDPEVGPGQAAIGRDGGADPWNRIDLDGRTGAPAARGGSTRTTRCRSDRRSRSRTRCRLRDAVR